MWYHVCLLAVNLQLQKDTQPPPSTGVNICHMNIQPLLSQLACPLNHCQAGKTVIQAKLSRGYYSLLTALPWQLPCTYVLNGQCHID